MNTVRGVDMPMAELLLDVGSKTVPYFLRSTNNTITDAMDLAVVVQKSDCIRTSARNSLPNPTILLNFVNSVDGSLNV